MPTASRSGVVSTQATATSNYTSHGAQVTSSNTAMSAAPHGPGGPKSATRTAKKDEAGGTINKEVRMKRAGDGDKEKKRYVRGDKDKEEKEEEVEPWWPPFEFDGRKRSSPSSRSTCETASTSFSARSLRRSWAGAS